MNKNILLYTGLIIFGSGNWSIIANNYFWLNGRKPFKENKDLSREPLRIGGFFFNSKTTLLN